ncbi:unnamed protein product [Didymodactylos carnosus]|uniref:Uncharacterized protein n=1 Tax=Didymodactylos carnosus TaxID=1234261 RepID=A0A815Y712_9BILA|nr:unnamed protein product [Didymodactylos carnosus]CAF4428988.1 unnamed protein product [Didymodactylos carnosus]
MKSPTAKMSSFLDQILRPIFDRETSHYTLENSLKFLDKIELYEITDKTRQFTFDITDHQYKTMTSLRKDRVQRRIQFAVPEIVACSPMKKRKHNNDGEPDFQFPPLPILSLPKQQENVQPQQTKKRQALIAPNITKSSITIKPPNWMLPEHARQLKASNTPLDAAPKVTTSNYGKPPEHPSKPLPQRRTTNYYFNQIPQEERRYNERQEPIRQRTESPATTTSRKKTFSNRHRIKF